MRLQAPAVSQCLLVSGSRHSPLYDVNETTGVKNGGFPPFFAFPTAERAMNIS
jgi:hypothetical protein